MGVTKRVDEDVERELGQLKDENARLHAAIRQRDQTIKDMKNNVEEKQESTSLQDRAIGVFCMLLVILAMGWMFNYVFIEKMGRVFPEEGIGADVVFGGAAVAVICKWAEVGWRLIEWLMIPKFVTVLLAIVIAVVEFQGHPL